MSTGKLVAFFIAWIFASMTIAVVTAVVVTEILTLLGAVATGTRGYDLSLNIVTFATFAVLVSIPFVFRRRFTSERSDEG